jgi:hypothetical protein
MLIRYWVPATLMVFCASAAVADDSTGSAMQSRWTLGYSTIGLDKKAADKAFVGDNASQINLEFETSFSNQWVARAGLALLSYDDKAGFSQDTEDVFGDVDSSDSEASSIPVYASAGYGHYSTGQWPIYLSLQGGYLYNAFSERAIPNCSNCASEDIDIAGGVFASAAGGLIVNDHWTVGLQVDRFLTGDMATVVGLRVSWGPVPGAAAPVSASYQDQTPAPYAGSTAAPYGSPSITPHAEPIPAPAPAPSVSPRLQEEAPEDKPGGNLWSPNSLEM